MNSNTFETSTNEKSMSLISVTIICFNGAKDIRCCLQALRKQTWSNFEIVAIDNASSDDSATIFQEFEEVRLIKNLENIGFPGAQNQAIRESRGGWIVSLNLDTRAEPTFLEEMIRAMQLDSRIGIVCPKVLRMGSDGSSESPPRIDSTGCYVTPKMRHHDRGSNDQDLGQYDRPDYVFGYTGAAAMFRRDMLIDLAFGGMIFDEDFFVTREDADFSWRAQLAGWRCLYTPCAVVFHKRVVFENNRLKVSSLINMHSTKNRFLLRINNVTLDLYRHLFFAATMRDVGVVAYVFLRERASIPALLYILRAWKRLFAKRALIQQKKQVSDAYLRHWFSNKPTAMPLEPESMSLFLQRHNAISDSM